MPLGNNPGLARMRTLGRCLDGAESAFSLRWAPEDWILTMMERMLLHCEQQFDALSSQALNSPAQHAASARALGSLERTMGNLARAHAQLRLSREQKVAMTDEQLRAKIDASLSRLAIGFRAAGVVELLEPKRDGAALR